MDDLFSLLYSSGTAATACDDGAKTDGRKEKRSRRLGLYSEDDIFIRTERYYEEAGLALLYHLIYTYLLFFRKSGRRNNK